MANLFYKSDSSEIDFSVSETAYYLGYKKSVQPEPEILKKIENACVSMKKVIVPQAVYEEFDLLVEEENIRFADLNFKSKDLARNLGGCSKVVIFAATIGSAVDMMIRRSQLSGSSDSAIMQAAGAMFIEAFVDKFNDFIKEKYRAEGFTTRPRYSPGYGDVSIQMQKDFFRLLECRKIGLSLMNTLIMAPEKSVTAFIGLK